MVEPETRANASGQVQTEINRIEELINQSQQRRYKLRWISRGVTLAILVVFGVYSLLFYQTITRNLAAEKFAESIQTHVTQLAPFITDAVLEVLVGVSPVYVDLAGKKAEKMTPALMATLEKQADQLVAHLSAFGQKEVRDRLENIVKRAANDFKKAYPDLTDEQLEWFVEESEEELEGLFTQVAEHIVTESLPEILEMKFLAESLGDHNLPKEEMELIRLFLHKLLQRVDMEIMEADHV
ncbi:MAG: hypothetical protein AB1641_06775 [Thermodesulfobacteriota bacterium]